MIFFNSFLTIARLQTRDTVTCWNINTFRNFVVGCDCLCWSRGVWVNLERIQMLQRTMQSIGMRKGLFRLQAVLCFLVIVNFLIPPTQSFRYDLGSCLAGIPQSELRTVTYRQPLVAIDVQETCTLIGVALGPTNLSRLCFLEVAVQ